MTGILEKPIACESLMLKRLQEEGWAGSVSQLRALATLGEELRKRWENECSYAWAGNSDFYKKGTARRERHVIQYAREAGLTLFLQSDPRGATIYVRAHPLPISDTNYSSVAHCLYYQDASE